MTRLPQFRERQAEVFRKLAAMEGSDSSLGESHLVLSLRPSGVFYLIVFHTSFLIVYTSLWSNFKTNTRYSAKVINRRGTRGPLKICYKRFDAKHK